MKAFDPFEFVEACQQALSHGEPQAAVRELLERAVRHGPALADAMPPDLSNSGGLLHYSPQLTILWLEWPPGMYDPPHDHGCWGAAGVCVGAERGQVYRRTANGNLVEVAESAVTSGDVALMGPDLIHGVRNPLSSWTLALHVYAGDILGPHRREWLGPDFVEQQWDATASFNRYVACVEEARQATRDWRPT